MRYQYIREHREEFSVKRMCQLLGVTRSGYYAWHSDQVSPRTLENQVLVEQIRVEYKTSRQTYGSPRIWARLLGRGMYETKEPRDHSAARIVAYLDGLPLWGASRSRGEGQCAACPSKNEKHLESAG